MEPVKSKENAKADNTDTFFLKSIDELLENLQKAERQTSPVMEEYMLMGAEPFFKYYEENVRKYAGIKIFKKYSEDYQKVKAYWEDKNDIKYLTDLVTSVFKNKEYELVDSLVNLLFICPMRVVRAQMAEQTQ